MIRGLVYTHYFYLGILLFSIAGLLLADWRYHLALWCDWRASLISISIVMVLLLAGDIAGIKLGIFSTNQDFVSGIHLLSPNLPVEELFFLFLLCYVTLIVFRALSVIPNLIWNPESKKGQIPDQVRDDKHQGLNDV